MFGLSREEKGTEAHGASVAENCDRLPRSYQHVRVSLVSVRCYAHSSLLFSSKVEYISTCDLSYIFYAKKSITFYKNIESFSTM